MSIERNIKIAASIAALAVPAFAAPLRASAQDDVTAASKAYADNPSHVSIGSIIQAEIISQSPNDSSEKALKFQTGSDAQINACAETFVAEQQRAYRQVDSINKKFEKEKASGKFQDIYSEPKSYEITRLGVAGLAFMLSTLKPSDLQNLCYGDTAETINAAQQIGKVQMSFQKQLHRMGY